MREAETLARWVYDEAFCSQEAPPGPASLLHRILGGDRVRFDEPARASVRGTPGNFVVTVPRGLPNERLCLAMAAALATIAGLSALPTISPAGELMDAAMGAILMPRQAILRAMAATGPRVEHVAKAFVVPRAFAEKRLRALGIGLASGEYVRFRVRDVG